MAARSSWVILGTLAVVALSAAAGVVTWDARVRPSTAEPVPAWSATLRGQELVPAGRAGRRRPGPGRAGAGLTTYGVVAYRLRTG